MENIELLAVSIAFLLLAFNVMIITTIADKQRYKKLAKRVLGATGIVPGFAAVAYGAYAYIMGTDSDLSRTLFFSGLLLETSTLQLTQLLQKDLARPKASSTPNADVN